ncbi:serine/threonine-protein kinase [Actinomadura sp. SCN-SB]|uniref:serine/threonine-protein kinase n=1 Tax=Actinomadura sp. SCN-SB TaxID=3373092 RepID=UPI0037521926
MRVDEDLWRLGGFTELRELGTGAQGRVVLARHDEGGGAVAIKYLARREGDDEAVEALRAEAGMLARVSDPHVVRLYRFVSGRHGAALVMEAVNGVSLKRLLAESGPLEPEAALTVLKGSLLGLAAAHAVGVVHRDYKPANVVVRGDGLSKLIDFGVAALAGDDSRSGTPAYMAPEVWRGEPASPATDVYSATCVFFECVTGHRPYVAEGVAALMARHLNDDVPVEAVPDGLRDLVARGMAKEADGRPPGAEVFVAELEAAATTAYGSDWERRGVRALAMGAVALAALFPLGAAALGSGGAAGTAAGAASGTAVAATSAGGGSAGAGAGAAAGGGVLAATGAKVAVAAVGTAAAVAAGGGTAAYIASGGGGGGTGPAPRPVAAIATVNRTTPLPGRPALQIQNAQVVTVTGLSDPALQQRVNTALRGPLDRTVASFRSYVTGPHTSPVTVPRCATVAAKASIRYSGPRLVSAVYSFDTTTCTVADEDPDGSLTVNVDLRTGRALRAQDILRDTGPRGVAALARAMPELPPDDRFCLPDGLDPGDFLERDGLRPVVEISFTRERMELNIDVSNPDCGLGAVWPVPYPAIMNLIQPDVAAALPAAASPTPERT